MIFSMFNWPKLTIFTTQIIQTVGMGIFGAFEVFWWEVQWIWSLKTLKIDWIPLEPCIKSMIEWILKRLALNFVNPLIREFNFPSKNYKTTIKTF